MIYINEQNLSNYLLYIDLSVNDYY